MGEEIKLEVKEKTVEEEAEWDAKDERATAAKEKRGGSWNHRERELQAHMFTCHLSVSHSLIDLVARSLAPSAAPIPSSLPFIFNRLHHFFFFTSSYKELIKFFTGMAACCAAIRRDVKRHS